MYVFYSVRNTLCVYLRHKVSTYTVRYLTLIELNVDIGSVVVFGLRHFHSQT
jgi:hypothetical protein